ncbi:MAG: hypothetical protein AAFP76_03300 [Bacteroidota bacterium]
MKTTFLCLLTLIFLSASLNGQSFNREIVPEGKSPVLLGKINKEGLSNNSYATWFEKNYSEYMPKEETVDQLSSTLQGYTVTAFMGTWCGDSKREVPRFYKILEAANFPLDRLTLIGVSRERATYKQSPGGEEEGLNIHRVPTFIFYKDGREINRIVEHPVNDLESDILQLLQGDYISNYHAVTVTANALEEMGVTKFRKKSKKLVPGLQKEAQKWSELNTLSYLLFLKGQREESIAVAELNIKLFPDEAGVYTSLANKLAQTGAKKEALANYERAMALDPKNKQAQKGLAQLKKS